MKHLIAVLVVLGSVVASAKSTLRIPVRMESGLTAAEINKQLEAKGFQLLPLYMEVSTEDKLSGYEVYEKTVEAVTDALHVLGIEDDDAMAFELYPNSNNSGTCYTGEGGQAVINLAFSLAGSYYTEQMNPWGWRYKQRKSINDEYGDSEEIERLLNQDSKLWKEWRGTGEAMLMVVAVGDSGDDMNETIIYKCK